MYKFQSASTLDSLPECQGTPCSKQVSYLMFNWQQWDSNLQPLSSQTFNHLAKLGEWLNCIVSTYLYGAYDCILL